MSYPKPFDTEEWLRVATVAFVRDSGDHSEQSGRFAREWTNRETAPGLFAVVEMHERLVRDAAWVDVALWLRAIGHERSAAYITEAVRGRRPELIPADLSKFADDLLRLRKGGAS